MKTEGEEIDVFSFVIWKRIKNFNKESISPTLLSKGTNVPKCGI